MTDGRGEPQSDRSAAHPSLVPSGRHRPGGPADLVEQPGWRRMLAAARHSLERTGGRLDTTVTLSTPTDDERLVIIGITGTHRSAAAARLSIRLSAVDEHLRAAYGVGLIDVLAATAPLRNRPSDRTREAVARDAVLAVAHEGRHAGSVWYAEWLDGLRRDGTLTRVVRTGLRSATWSASWMRCPRPTSPCRSSPTACWTTRRPQRGAATGARPPCRRAWQQAALPVGGEQERALWESVGLVPDDLASQVLVLNAPATGGLVGRWLTEAAQAGVPMRVTLHQLRLAPLALTCGEVHVCENPAVLRAATTALGTQAPMLICTEGVPSVAAHTLLCTAPQDAVIRWRNDFDWTGVRLTAAALQRYPGAVPWRMTSADYLPGAGTGTALLGTPTETPWDPSLGESMRRTGRAVMEERLLDRLIADLRAAGAG